MRQSNPSASFAVCPPAGDLTVELFQSLQDRRFRDRNGLFLAEGFRALHAVVAHGARVAGLAVCRELLHSSEARLLIKRLQDSGCPTVKLSQPRFQELARAAEPQGVLLAIRQEWRPLPEQITKRDLWLGVENIRSPGNLGTLLRSAHAVGARGLMVFGPPRDRADPYDPGCVRSSMGSLFAMDVVQTNHQAFRKWPLRNEIRVLGADGGSATDYRRISYQKPTLLMLGEERAGLSEGQMGSCDGFARIPMYPGPDSLNLATAGTVLLYEIYNQRHPLKRR
jgi:RNA methyltransferase, TrmH family